MYDLNIPNTISGTGHAPALLISGYRLQWKSVKAYCRGAGLDA